MDNRIRASDLSGLNKGWPTSGVSCRTWKNTKSWSEPFIWTTGVDWSNSINHNHIQVLSNSKYSLLFLPVVGIEPETFRWLHLEALSNHNLIHCTTCTCWIHGTVDDTFTSRFRVDSWIRHETPEEGRRTYRPKHCEYNNKDEVNSPNIQSNVLFWLTQRVHEDNVKKKKKPLVWIKFLNSI